MCGMRSDVVKDIRNFSNKPEAFDSELLENIEEIFSLYDGTKKIFLQFFPVVLKFIYYLHSSRLKLVHYNELLIDKGSYWKEYGQSFTWNLQSIQKITVFVTLID